MASLQNLDLYQWEVGHPCSIFDIAREEAMVAYDRRSLPRVKGLFPIAFGDENGVGLNLSFGGMQALLPEPVWPGNIFPLRFELEHCESFGAIECGAEVLQLVPHKDQVAMRLRFIDISDHDRRCIARWMTWQTT